MRAHGARRAGQFLLHFRICGQPLFKIDPHFISYFDFDRVIGDIILLELPHTLVELSPLGIEADLIVEQHHDDDEQKTLVQCDEVIGL